jgi:predicted lipid-binding transport protein (Tim44 family)
MIVQAWKWLGIVISAVALVTMTVPDEAWARAGGGRSGGSRGSRSFSSPSRSYSTPSSPSRPTTQPFTQPRPAPMSQPAPSGGFWRGVAGGVLGGILGGLLFRSLGFAGGFGGFGGGFGMFDLLLLAGIGYLIYWMVRRHRRPEEAPAAAYQYSRVQPEPYGTASSTASAGQEPPLFGAEELERGLDHIRQMDSRFDPEAFVEWCTDTFFRIQGAWMHRDLDKLRPLLTEEMQETFHKDLEALRATRQINRLENITVRSVELTEAWQEQGKDYVTARYLANLLDYTVDEATGAIVRGSNTEPVKFEEFWTWVRPVGPNPWRLSGIHQAD